MIKKILVVIKQTVYERFVLNKKDTDLINLISNNHPLTKGIIKEYETTQKSIAILKKCCKNFGIESIFTHSVTKNQVKQYELIITLGGDGTLLKTSQFVEKTPIVGINSNPESSIGYLCLMNINEVSDKLPLVLNKKIEPIKIRRLTVEINKRKIPYRALNDILFADINPAGTARYTIKIDGYEEQQKSSGVWISTAAGSTAAINAAGGTVMPITSKNIQYLVREPYIEKNKIYHLTKGIVPERIEIVSAMFQANVFLDGKAIKFHVGFGDHIVIRRSLRPLHLYIETKH